MTTPRRSLSGPNDQPQLPESGIILIDLLTNTVTSDRGLLRQMHQSDSEPVDNSGKVAILSQIMNIIRQRDANDQPPRSGRFQIGRRKYRCRSYMVAAPDNSGDPPLLAVHFELDSDDRVGPLVEEYSLTEREQEVLRGIADGLTTKELAERLKISPNTVKAFVRLIMLKLQVTTRTGIVGKLLEYSPDSDTPGDDRPQSHGRGR